MCALLIWSPLSVRIFFIFIPLHPSPTRRLAFLVVVPCLRGRFLWLWLVSSISETSFNNAALILSGRQLR